MTSKAKAEAILKDGFRDASKQYLSDQEWAGVWVSDAPFWQDNQSRGCHIANKTPGDKRPGVFRA